MSSVQQQLSQTITAADDKDLSLTWLDGEATTPIRPERVHLLPTLTATATRPTLTKPNEVKAATLYHCDRKNS